MSQAIHPFDYQHCAAPTPRSWRWAAYSILFLMLVVLLPSCAGKSALPPPPAPAVEVLVPVTKPCEVAQVPSSPLPSAGGVPSDIYEAVKRVLADRQVLLGDREKLQAANSNPCPEVTQ